MTGRRALHFTAALLLGATARTSAQAPDRHFAAGYAGTLPTDPNDLARTYFDAPAVRRLIYRLEAGPATRVEVDSALAGTGYRAEDLVRVKLLSLTEGRFRIGFSYFTAADMEVIHRVAAEYVPRLVDGYLARRAELSRIFAAYPARSVPESRLAFTIIAGISLNWDGLRLGLEEGFRRPSLVTGPGWKYSFWASEETPGHSSLGYIWGSSTFPAGSYNYADPVDFAFSSFGDPSSDPRMSFPDLLYLPKSALAAPVAAIAARIGLRDETRFGTTFKEVMGFELGRPVAAILFALRREPQSETALRSVVTGDWQGRVPAILDLLEEIQYLSRDPEGRYRLTVPVLDREDAPMTRAALALSRRVIGEWLARYYGPIRKELAGLTALRQGVAYEALFTQIWHELFGLATRELATDEVIADARGPGVRYPGALPLVWRMSLYHLDAQ